MRLAETSLTSGRIRHGFGLPTKMRGSNVGFDASASTSPFRASSATIAPPFAFQQPPVHCESRAIRIPCSSARSAAYCRPTSIVSVMLFPGIGVFSGVKSLRGLPERVDEQPLEPGRAAQVAIERGLDARLADLVAADELGVRPLRQLLLRHLADVAEDVRGERAVRVVADVALDELHPGELP